MRCRNPRRQSAHASPRYHAEEKTYGALRRRIRCSGSTRQARCVQEDGRARAGSIWIEHGALQYWEGTADDVQPGKVTSFPQSVQLKDDEIVVFSWVVYKSREHRDGVIAKVMDDPRLKDMMDPKSMPFDGSRMFWGGFARLVEFP